MKRISNIAQLKTEKAALKQKQAELEMAIRQDWYAVKESLRPENVTSQVLSSVFSESGRGLIKSVVPFLVSLAAGRLTGRLLAKTK